MAYKTKYYTTTPLWSEFELTTQGNVIIDSSIDIETLRGKIVVSNFVYLVYQRINQEYRMIKLTDLYGSPYSEDTLLMARELGEYLSTEKVDNIRDVAKFLSI